MKAEHQQRIADELKRAGITGYALHKAEGRYLPQLIENDESIMAAVYGRTDYGSAMLVATDRRVLFLDKKPLMTTSDEISYEMIGGVGVSKESGMFVAVTLRTRVGDYVIRYVNQVSATRFQDYLRKTRLEGAPQNSDEATAPTSRMSSASTALIDAPASSFLADHSVGVLSTVGRDGQLWGTVVYYTYDPDIPAIYMLTKSDTQKTHNILATHQVAFTVFDEPKRQTIQLQGFAEIESDSAVKTKVFREISQPKQYQDGVKDPPVTQLQAGGYIVFRITITSVQFSDYSQ